MNGARARARGLAAVCLLALAGCATTQTAQRIRPAIATAEVRQEAGELTAEQEEWLEDLCVYGPPKLEAFYTHRPTTLLVTGGRAILHDDQAKTAIWVCEHLRNEDVHGGLTGTASWRADPVLCPAGSRCTRGAVDTDYDHSGYDRGHLATNSNQRLDEQRKRETFYLSNAAPQVGEAFNQSVWQAMEMELHRWVKDLGDFWAISGVLYHDAEEDDAATADGLVEITTIGNGAVEVPTHFYKILVWEEDGQDRQIAVVMENRDWPADETYREHIVPIDWIEERLGVDFFSVLDDVDQDALESEPGTPFEVSE